VRRTLTPGGSGNKGRGPATSASPAGSSDRRRAQLFPFLRSAFETPTGEALRQAALALSTLPLVAQFAVMQRHYVVGFRGSGLAG
jgi:hypothetical protein